MDRHDLMSLPASEGKGRSANVVVETPKGSRNKYKYDEKLGLFRLHKILPAGVSYNRYEGRVFAILGRHGPEVAWELIESGTQKYQNSGERTHPERQATATNVR